MSGHSHAAERFIAQGESLTVEFKSDRKCLPDRELLAAVVSLANTEGGDLFLGVEDDGTITGLHPSHQKVDGLYPLISNRTNPSLSVHVEAVCLAAGTIAWIKVPKSRQLIATSEGLLQRRRLMANGKPEAVPFYPHEFTQRQSSLGLLDPSSLPIVELTADDLSPLERHRIRELIQRFGGDQMLLPLADNELDGALGLTVNVEGITRPTVAGLLLLGKAKDLRRLLPAHEVAFQVLHGTDVRVNEFFHKPLLQTFEEVEQLFRARVEEEEIQVGLFRVPIPNFDRRAFREAFVNSLVHRDYSTLGAVHVKIDDDGLSISSPGGFVEGVTFENLLTVSPHSRNPLLADIIKRIGLAERTGRGIDRIFEGMLRYGRPAPDYSTSDTSAVKVQMFSTAADLEFLKMILQQEDQSGAAIPIDSLIILSRLREEHRLTATDLTLSVQKSETTIRTILEKLLAAGLVEAGATEQGQAYILNPNIYRRAEEKVGSEYLIAFDSKQQEQLVLRYIDKHGSIRRAETIELCHISKDQAYKLLSRLKERGDIKQEGERKGAFYVRKH